MRGLNSSLTVAQSSHHHRKCKSCQVIPYSGMTVVARTSRVTQALPMFTRVRARILIWVRNHSELEIGALHGPSTYHWGHWCHLRRKDPPWGRWLETYVVSFGFRIRGHDRPARQSTRRFRAILACAQSDGKSLEWIPVDMVICARLLRPGEPGREWSTSTD